MRRPNMTEEYKDRVLRYPVKFFYTDTESFVQKNS